MIQPINVLLVEDNPADAELLAEVMGRDKLHIALHVEADGIAALQYLRTAGAGRDHARPDLIILDLNLPLKDGRELLHDIKTDPALRLIPVVVLTSSEAESDVAKTYDLGASAYVAKPLDFAGFARVVKSLEEFWFTVVRLPPK